MNNDILHTMKPKIEIEIDLMGSRLSEPIRLRKTIRRIKMHCYQ